MAATTQPPTDSPQPHKSSNGMIQLLSTVAHSGDKWVQFGILVLVGLSGFGNWIATWNSADRNKQEIEVSRRVNWEGQERIRQEVFRQVAEIHRWMQAATDEFHKGNEDSAANRRTLSGVVRDMRDSLDNQTKLLQKQNELLKGQNSVMENDTKILDQINRALAPVTLERAYPTPSTGGANGH